MVVLGVDTSLRSTGYGIVEVKGSLLKALDFGNVRNPQALPVSKCLSNIHAKIEGLIAAWKPDVAAIEEVIYGKNALTMLALGQARGAVITACSDANVPIYEYEPRRMKRAVCGNALAEKGQIQRMIKTLLSLESVPQNDAADALGLAVCHIHSNSLISGERPI